MHGGDIYSNHIEYDFSVNLNPLDCSEVTERILKSSSKRLGEYPDYYQRRFRTSIARAEGVSDDEVIGGNGASELLMGLVTMLKPKKAMLMNPCFGGYRHVLETISTCETVDYCLSPENSFLPDEAFLKELEVEASKGLDILFITNPNNPTGRNMDDAVLLGALEICKKHGICLIVDECFLRMSKGRLSMTAYINEYNGLYVVNAYTKLFAIPGIRVGYVISNSENINRLKPFLPEWNLSVIAEEAGVICSEYICDDSRIAETKSVIDNERKYLSAKLDEMGFTVYESDTSFILIYSRWDIYDFLKSKGILIRNCMDYKGLGNGFYRIAVKSHKENEILIQTLNSGR